MVQTPFEKRIPIGIPNDPQSSCDFVHSFRPIYIVSRIFGHMPFSIVYNANGGIDRAVVNTLDIVWGIISFGIYSYALFLSSNWVRTQRSYKVLPTISIVIDAFVFGSIQVLSMFTIVFDMCCRWELTALIKNFTIFDKKVRLALNFFFFCRKEKKKH